ncbi:hypothetical protein AAG906_040535 [Vitis piasezkii]
MDLIHLLPQQYETLVKEQMLHELFACTCHLCQIGRHRYAGQFRFQTMKEDAIANFLARRASLPAPTTNSSIIRSSKVTPHPSIPKSSSIPGSPRLVRSCAVRRDIVRDWNFEEVVMEH